MSDIDDGIVSEFLLESRENLESLDQELLVLERHPDSRDTLGSVFRTIHTLKGTCGFLGYSKLESVAHVAEGLLGRLRAGEVHFDESIGNLLGSLVVAVREMLGHIESTRTEGDTDYTELIEAFRRVPLATAESAPAAEPEPVPSRAAGAPARVKPAPTPASPKKTPDAATAGPRRIFDEMIADGRLDREQVDLALQQQKQGDPRRLGEILVDNGALMPHEVLEALVTNGHPVPQPAAARSAIRVDVRLLERLMNQVGELVLARNQMLQLLEAQRLEALPEVSQRLSSITTELQDAVLKTRMQPIQVVWASLPRLVRDVARECGKSVRLEMEGSDTELDRTLLEAIKDPLIHLVRNAIDHGIETAEARRAAGKPEEGVLRLRAFHEGGRVGIEIADDGAGISVDRVRERALRKGLVSEERAARMTDSDWIGLIFTPGFSTAASVTRVSGRGVGMDVVKTNVERIGGTLEVRNHPGQGTQLEIRIPLTLAIVPVLCVGVGSVPYALPQSGVLEILRLDPARGREIERVQGAPVYRLRGGLLPIVFLSEVLGTEPDSAGAGSHIVVLASASRRFGLVVDHADDFRELVVKPLSAPLLQSNVFAGATILGDGRVALILDPERIAARAGLAHPLPGAAAQESIAHSTGGLRQRHLWFEIREGWPLAVPLAEVSRVEEIDASRVHLHLDGPAVLHRDELMPLVSLAHVLEGIPGPPDLGAGSLRVIVIDDGGRSFGFVVHRVLDLVECEPGLDRWTARFGIRGSVIIGGAPVEVLDPRAIARRLRGGRAAEESAGLKAVA